MTLAERLWVGAKPGPLSTVRVGEHAPQKVVGDDHQRQHASELFFATIVLLCLLSEPWICLEIKSSLADRQPADRWLNVHSSWQDRPKIPRHPSSVRLQVENERMKRAVN